MSTPSRRLFLSPWEQLATRSLPLLAVFSLITGSLCAQLSPGSVNTNFTVGTGFDLTVLSIARQPDAKLVVGGQFTTYNGVARNRLLRLNYDGSNDATFTPGAGADSSVNSVAVSPDGKIVAGGDFLNFNNVARRRLVRLNANGTVDTSFAPTGGANAGPDGSVAAVAVQVDGKVLLGGSFLNVNGTTRTRIARLNLDGTVDPAFNPGTGFNNTVNALALQPDGKILVAGLFTSVNGTTRNRVARLNTDGSVDATFVPGTLDNGYVNSVSVASDGKVLLGGHIDAGGNSHLLRLNSNGSLDTTFNTGNNVINSTVNAVVVHTDGKVLIGGYFSAVNGLSRNGVARMLTNGVVDAAFVPGTGANNTVWALALEPEGNFVAGGNFTTYAGLSRSRIARIQSEFINQPPVMVALTNQTVLEDSGTTTLTLSGLAAGQAGENTQLVTNITATSSNPALVPNPTVTYTPGANTGTLAFTPVANAFGSATITIVIQDNAGTANGGVDKSTNSFTLTVSPVNDAPSATLASSALSVIAETGAQTLANFAANISAGPANESGQSINFIVMNNNNALFSVQPAIAANGTLTYTPLLGASGTATVTVRVHDDGGTANGGVDTSAPMTFTIDVTSGNKPPTVNFASATVTVLEDSGAASVSSFAALSPGPANESAQTVSVVSVTAANTSLFSVQPAIAANGTLTFTPAANANGSATVTVIVQDDGGTANGGVDKATNTFTIAITPVNDAPSFALPGGPAAAAAQGPWTVSTVASELTGHAGGVVKDSAGNLFVCDSFNNQIKKITPAGSVSVFATGLQTLCWLTIDANDNLYVTAGDEHRVKKVTPAGVVSVLAGNGSAGYADGTGAGAVLNYPTGIALDSAGNLFVAEGNNNVIRKITPAGVVTTFVGTAGTSGGTDGTGAAARFTSPMGMGIDSADNLYVVEQNNHTLRKITPAGVVTTVAGLAGSAGAVDGTGSAARFLAPQDVKVDPAGNLLVADMGNHAIRQVTPSGVVTTIIGVLGDYGFVDGTGSAVRLSGPRGLWIDGSGTVYIGEWNNYAVRKAVAAVAAVGGSSGSYTLAVNEDAGAYTGGANFATSISAGPANESAQVVTFTVSNDNNALFSDQPTISAAGTLSFTPAANGFGSATVTVIAKDNGGTANGGVDTSAPQTFTITVNSVNDAPSVTFATNNIVRLQDSGVFTGGAGFASFSPGPANESAQTLLGYTVANNNNALFSSQPAISTSGVLTFTLAAAVNGTATVTVIAQDDGGTANGGVDKSTNTFTITVGAVNHAPSFALPAGSAPVPAGATWTARESGRNWNAVASSADGTKLVSVVDGGQIFTSTDSGATWTARENARGWSSVASSADGTKLVAVVWGGQIYTSTDAGITWTARESVRNWRGVASSADGTKLVALDFMGSGAGGQIYTSTDSGATWTARENNRNWVAAASSADGSKLVAVSWGGQIYTSTDSGVSWTARASNQTWHGVASSADGSKLVAGVHGGQLYTSTDSGVSWTARASGLNWTSEASSADGVNLAATAVGDRIYTSTDSGVTWTAQDNYRNWRAVASSADGSKLVAVVIGGGQIYTSVGSSGAPYTVTVNEDAGAQSVTGFATSISAGPANEAGQTVTFTVSNDNNALFSVQPAISAAGTLSFTPAANAFGSATVTVIAKDDGGTANGGVDTSAPQTFTVTVTPVNDAPTITFSANNVTVLEDSGAASISGFASFSVGPANESAQTITSVTVSSDNPALFSVAPALTGGTLTFTPAANANGSATVTVIAQDSGGTANGGVDKATNTFTITVTAVNDAPVITFANSTVSVPQDSGAASVSAFATITTGPANESAQTITSVSVSSDNPALFSAGPALVGGTLTFTPAAGAAGSATVTVVAQDNGGTANGGVDKATNTFTIVVTIVNHAPTFTLRPVNTQSSLVSNGSFETGSFTGWVMSDTANTSPALAVRANGSNLGFFNVASSDGTYSATHGFSGTQAGSISLAQDVTIPPNGVATLSFTYRAAWQTFGAAGNRVFRFAVQPSGGGADLYSQTLLTAAPNTFVFQTANTPVTLDLTAFTGQSVRLVFVTDIAAGDVGNGSFQLDNVQLSATTPDFIVYENSGPNSTVNFATDIVAGPATEASQTVTFTVANNNNGLFSSQPAIAADGTLTFTTAQDVNGGATVTVYARDNGGTANGGVDTSVVKTFSVTVLPVNSAPRITPTSVTVLEDSGAFSGTRVTFATGPADESGQSITNVVTSNDNNALFSVQPVVSTAGVLTFTPAVNANGSATVTVIAQDNGGTANGGVNKATNTFTITVTPVNDAPSFALPQGPAVAAGAGWTAQASGSRAWGQIVASTDGTKLAAIVNNGPIYTSFDSGVTWTAQASGSRVWTSIASSADGTKLAATVSGGGIYTSSDSGVTWTLQTGAPTSAGWGGIGSSADGTHLVAAGYFIPVYASTDSGVTWTQINTSAQWGPIKVSADGTKIAIVNMGGGPVYYSSNFGASWSTGTGTGGNLAPLAGSSDGTKLVTAAAQNGTIYTSTDSGAHWTSRESIRAWNALASSADGTKLVAAVQNGLIYTSTDSGVTWTAQSGSGSRNWNGLAMSADGSKMFAADGSGFIYTSGAGFGPYNLTVNEDSGGYSGGMGFVTGISPGPADESAQAVSFTVSNDNNALFAAQPAMSSSGTLTFTPAANAYGSATVTVVAQDNGGTANGGVDTSAAQTFTITVSPVNDAPTVALSANNVTVLEDSGIKTVSGFATVTSFGPNESAQTLLGHVLTAANPALFSVQPAINTSGVLTFTPAANANGSTTVTVVSQDSGGTANGGVDKTTNTFTITITPVNDAPSFALNSGLLSVVGVGFDGTTRGYAVGTGGYGQLAAGVGVTSSGTPREIVNITSFTQVSAGDYQGMGLTADGTVWVWGRNDSGQLANGVIADGGNNASYVPLQVAGLANVIKVDAGFGWNMVLKADGTVWTWGNNSSGQLGLGSIGSPVTTPTQVPGLTAITDIVASGQNAFALKSDGTLWTWGANGNGLLGRGAQWASEATPAAVSSLGNNVARLFPAVGTHVFVEKTDGTIWSWGDYYHGQRGDGSSGGNFNPTPVVIPALGAHQVLTMAAGQVTSFAVMNDGSVKAWGANYNGVELGLGSGNGRQTTPVTVPGLANVVSVSPDWGGLALDASGRVYAWGQSGAANVYATPTLVAGLSNITAISSGQNFFYALGNYSSTLMGIAVNENSGSQTVTSLLTGIAAGPANESAQTVSFTVSNDNNALFSTQPAISTAGTLTYTLAANVSGTAVVTVVAHDDGGTANGGVDTSTAQIFGILVNAVNDAPTVALSANTVTVLEDSGLKTVSGFATVTSFGPNESSQTLLGHTVAAANPALFSVQPAIDNSGVLTFTPAANANGSTTATVVSQDSGGTANGGVDKTTNTFTITITPVNDAPSFGIPAEVAAPAASPGGETWAAQAGAGMDYWFAIASSADGTKLAAVSGLGQIHTSTDSGVTWTARLTDANRNWRGIASSTDGTKLAAVNYNGQIYTSTDSGATWTARETTRYWWAIASSADGTKLVAANLNAGSGGYLYTSIDSGATWTERLNDFGRPWRGVASSADGTKLVAVAENSQVYTSTDSGVTWTARDSSRNWQGVASSADGTKLVAFVSAGQLYTSADSGATWTARDSNRNWTSVASSSDGSLLLASVNNGNLYTSADSGVTWTARDSTRTWQCVASSADGSKLAAGVYNGQIYTSAGVGVGGGGVAGTVTTLAGTAGVEGSADGSGAAAQFRNLYGVAVDAAGNVYVPDIQNHTLRKITPAGVVTTLAGSPGVNASVDGTGNAARFSSPSGAAVDGAGNVYVTDQGGKIRKVTPSGEVTTLAGSGSIGSADGTGAAASFYGPIGIAVDSTGDNIYVSDTYNRTIRKVTSAGVVTTIAGQVGVSGTADGTGSAAQFSYPWHLALDSHGDLYVADAGSLRKVTPAGIVITVKTFLELGGNAYGVTVDSADNVFVAIPDRHVIKQITSAGVVSTLVGNYGTSGSVDGIGTAATFSNPFAVALDNAGNLYVADTLNNTIRKVVTGAGGGGGSAAYTLSVLEDSGAYTGGANFATSISAGPADESAQVVEFLVSNDNNALFSSQPAIAANGTLTFTPAANASGTATVTVRAHDDGGTANGGVDTSAAQTFTIVVNSVNDAPRITLAANTVTVLEDSGAYSGALATFSTGPANESGQSIINVTVTGNSNPGLFSVAPAVSTSGVLTFTPVANANGSATVTIRAQDNGGTANGGVDTSAPVSFTIVVTAVNDAPSFAIPPGSPAVPAGDTWTARESGRNWNAVASSADGTKLVAVVDGGQIFTSTDSGATWTARENARGWSSVASSADGTKLVAVVWGGQIYTSTDSGVNWTAQESVRNWRGVASSADGTKLVAVDFMGSGAGGQIYTSTDSGATWTARESNRNWVAAASSADGTKLVAVSWFGQIYTSTDSGASWTARASSQAWHGVASSADGTKLVAGVHGGQIYTSTDSGVSWTARASSLNWTTVASSADGVNLAATAVGDRVYTSTDSGANWTARESTRNWRAVASSADGSKLVAVVIGGGQIYTSVGRSSMSYTVTVAENSGNYSGGANFATSISAGPANESAQVVDFLVSNDNTALFSAQPAIAADGTLSFTPASSGFGTATVTVIAHDDGGTANGGVDTSAAQTFTITVNPLATRVFLSGATPTGRQGETLVVPILLKATGTENAVGFTLNYDASKLTYTGAALGANATGASLLENTAPAASGRVGLVLTRGAGGGTFATGDNELLLVSFTVSPTAAVGTTPITFSDATARREVTDASATVIATAFVDGSVTIASAVAGTASNYEGDVAPRPYGSGNGSVTVADAVQIGRFAAGLDTANSANGEFQRADCAPLGTKGDGRITVADWVQSLRFAAGLDTPGTVGGPTMQAAGLMATSAKLPAGTRVVRVAGGSLTAGQANTVSVQMDAQGNEAGVSLSLSFDATALTFVSATTGSGAAGGSLIVNNVKAAAGKVGLVLVLPAGKRLAAGTQEIVTLTFNVTGSGSTAISLTGDSPVAREVADVNANPVGATFVGGTFNIVLPAGLKAAGLERAADGSLRLVVRNTDGTAVTAAQAAKYQVFVTANLGGAWTLLPNALVVENGALKIVDPSANGAGLRLYKLVETP